MQLHLCFTLLAIAIASLAGCSRQHTGATSVAAPMAVSAQLEAALAIMNPVKRDEALSAVAQAAAGAGDGDTAMTAVVAMANPISKDDAAVLSARQLAKTGKGAEATAIAKIIQNPVKRDEALLELTKL